MTHLLDHTDPTEVDDFFRRGEQYSLVPGSLNPPMGVDIAARERVAHVESDLAGLDRAVRSPEQIARRARYMRYVSLTMGTLVAGLVLVFANQAYAIRRSVVAMDEPESVSVSNGQAESAFARGEAGEVSIAPAVQPTVGAVDAHAEPGLSRTSSTSPAEVPTAGTEVPDAPAVEHVSAKDVRAKDVSAKPSGLSFSPKNTANASTAKKTRLPVSELSPTSARAKGTAKPVVAPATHATPVVAQKPADYKPPTASFSD